MSVTLLIAPLLAAAAPVADLAEIDRAVAAFTQSPAGSPGGPVGAVDRRLRLNPCAAPLSLSWHTQRRESVVVQCPLPGGWRLFVPILSAGSGPAGLPAVERGDAVTIAIEGDGFSVSQGGEALEAGAVGQWIKVRGTGASAQRTSPNQVMRAQVTRPGLVTVPLP
jgi:flagella basal body P-ring formation protein FlgA